MTSQLLMRSLHEWILTPIMHAAEKVFVENMFTLSVYLEPMVKSVPFAIPTKAVQMMRIMIMLKNKRVAANDPGAICLLANCYFKGLDGFPQDRVKAIELFSRAADLVFSKAHSLLGMDYYEVGVMKKAKFHYKAAAMAGTNWQGTTLDKLRLILETCNELKSI